VNLKERDGEKCRGRQIEGEAIRDNMRYLRKWEEEIES
jgi:hypothetical protein